MQIRTQKLSPKELPSIQSANVAEIHSESKPNYSFGFEHAFHRRKRGINDSKGIN